MDLIGFKLVTILNDFCVCCHYFSLGTLLTEVSVCMQRADGGAVCAVRKGERHQGPSLCQVIAIFPC